MEAVRLCGCAAFEVIAFSAVVELLTQQMLGDMDRLGGLEGRSVSSAALPLTSPLETKMPKAEAIS